MVEAKADYSSAADGLQQAKKYAEILWLKFAYSTNGAEIIEFDFLTAKETHLTEFPTDSVGFFTTGSGLQFWELF